MIKEVVEEDKPGFIKAYERDKQKELRDQINELTVRERLMRRVKHVIVEVMFEDDLGKFPIKCRLLTDHEQHTIIKWQEKLLNLRKNPNVKSEEFDQVTSNFYEVLAYPNGVCVDETLDLEFWKQGNYGIDVPLKIIREVIESSNKTIQEAKTFRQE